MIKNFSINNFRLFKDKTDFEISPITILIGPNNSGKSTFIRALRLLVESAKSSSLLYLLKSSSDTDYLSYNDVFGKSDSKDGVTFEFSLPISLCKTKNTNDSYENELNPNCIVKLNYIKDEANESPELAINFISIKLENEIDIFRMYQSTTRGFEGEDVLEYKYEANLDVFFDHNLEKALKNSAIRNLFERFHIDSDTESIIIKNLKFDIKKIAFNKLSVDDYLPLKNQTNLISTLIDIQGNLFRNSMPGISDKFLLSNFDQWNLDYINFFNSLRDIGEIEELNDEDVKIISASFSSLKEKLFHEFDLYCLNIFRDLKEKILSYDHYIPAFRGKMLREFGRNDSERINKTIFKLLDINRNINDKKDFCGVEDSVVYVGKRALKLAHGPNLKFVNAMIQEVFLLKLYVRIQYNASKSKYEVVFDDGSNIINAKNIDKIDKVENVTVGSKSSSEKVDNLTNLIDMGTGMYHLILFLIEIELAIIEGGFRSYDNYESNSEGGLSFKMVINKSNHTIIVEEPELSLHPNYQSLLADVIDNAYNFFGVNFIIETHSEYLIRKLQFLRAKNNFNQKTVLIYNMSKPSLSNPKSGNRKIEINLDGSLSESFGEGFFDEADKIALELFLLKKHQNN